jgi:CubicO group peptidase (beta-lactamase class C family)
MRIVSIVVKGVLALVVVLTLVGAGFYLADPLLWKRFATSMQGLDPSAVDWRQPQQPVRGGNVRLREDVVDGISPDALRAAMAYAEQTDSYALLVHHRGALIVERYWGGFGPDSRFDTASMHKSVMAMLLGQAIADGYIDSLDDPVGRYLAEWADDVRGEITLRQLATMSSGLLVEAFRPSPFSKGMRLVLGSDIEEITLSLPAEGAPGEDFQYLNFSAQALGIALTRAVGGRYAEYLSERLWQPLGAPDAAVWLDREGGMPRTFCCLLASAPAWVHVGVLMLNDGRVNGEPLLPEGWVAEMTRPSIANPNYGLQVWLGSPADGARRYNRLSSLLVAHSEPYLAPDVVFLDGAGGQRVYVIPSAELVIVRIGKSVMDWDDAILPNALLRGMNRSDAGTATVGR